MANFNIAIIGAGPAGSTLARLLHLANIPCVIFEGEASANVRSQGGTLDLHFDSGLAAIKECKLWDEFTSHCRYDGEAMVVADKYFRKYYNEQGKTGETKWGRPEIDRRKLREILLASLPEETVKWGKRLRDVEDHDGNFTICFEDGSRESGFDLIVGADGAFSRTRPLISDATPYYSGIGGLWGTIPDAEKRYPKLHQQVNKGSLMVISDGKSITGQQLGDGGLHVSIVWVRPADWGSDKILSAAELKKLALEECKGWDPRILSLFEAAEEDTLELRNFYMLPVGHTWKHRRGITLLGDAAHLMTPYSGEGVNLAMTDSMKLAHAIVQAHKLNKSSDIEQRTRALSDEVKNFEEDMFKRATGFQERTKTMMELMMFTPGAPYSSIEEWMYTAVSDVLPFGTHAIVKATIYAGYWVYKSFILPAIPDPKS